jgi:hypothetical protein
MDPARCAWHTTLISWVVCGTLPEPAVLLAQERAMCNQLVATYPHITSEGFESLE